MSPGAKAMSEVASTQAAVCECDSKTFDNGVRAPMSAAAPSIDASSTALVEAAAVSSNRSPSLAESSGKALVAIGTASTANGTTNTAQAKPYSTSAPECPNRLASTITTATEASCATRASTPASASFRTRLPMPGGNRSVGRGARRSFQAGTSAVATSASTPSVVPPDSRYSANGGRLSRRLTYCSPTAPNPAYAPTTTRLDSSGASAGAPNLRCDCKTPYSTTASPYSRTCGANTISIRVPTPVRLPCGHPLAPDSAAATIGLAATASSALTGTSRRMVQVSSAEAIWRTCSRASPAGPARTGTTTELRAPPRTMS